MSRRSTKARVRKGRPLVRTRPARRPRPQPAARDTPISRSMILDATRRLYARSDYTSVTMREIAREVGCRSPSLYHHFESKEEIFRALAEEGIKLVDAYRAVAETSDCVERLRERFRRYY